jgi:hypothetical protein
MCGSNLISGIARLGGVLAVVGLFGTRAVGSEPPLRVVEQQLPMEGVLLLREGGVLSGQISHAGDRYFVTEPGSEISVAAANVELVCRSLPDAYEHRRSALQQPTADDHLALAEWCLCYDLFSQAAEQLIAVRGLDARHPKLAVLERRLAVASRTLDARSAHSPSAASESSAIRAIEQPKPFVGEVTSEAVERFARKVQPILVNNCTNAGCHRSNGSQSFQLDRALLHDMGNRRSTQQNLAAVLALVDRERPQESPLLKVARTDHGGMTRPIFGPRQHLQFQQLVEWVGLVAHADMGDAGKPATVAESGVTAEPNAVAAAAELPASEQVTPAAYIADNGPDEGSTASHVEPKKAVPLRRGAAVEAWQPKDPFDPEIFNRQAARENARAAR